MTNFSVWWLNLWRQGHWQWCLTQSSTGMAWWAKNGTMWQGCSTSSWGWTSLALKWRWTATSALRRRRSRQPLQRREALERKRNQLLFTQTCLDPYSGSPTRVFAMHGVHRQLQPFQGSEPNEVKRWCDCKVTTIHHWYWQTLHLGHAGRSSPSQSSSVTCARPMASKKEFFNTHPKKFAKRSACMGQCDWHDPMHAGNIRGRKQFWHFVLPTAAYLKNRSIFSTLARLLLRCSTEIGSTIHIFTCLGANRLCSTKAGRNWTARHGKPFYWDTRKTPTHFWWPRQTSQWQGHQRSACHESSTSTSIISVSTWFCSHPRGKRRR